MNEKEIKKDLQWQVCYSETDLPDKHGRWARKCIYRGLCIARVNMIIFMEFTIYQTILFFPQNSNDMPHTSDTFDNFEEAKIHVEKLFTEFLHACR